MAADKDSLKHRNRRLALFVVLAVITMGALSFAAVPLYRLFCQITGFAGTPRIAQSAPEKALEKTITVRFNADVARDMPWEFKPEQNKITVKIGARALASYHARNKTDKPITGTAIYNVTPLKAAKYFHKIECFCFAEQTLAPGEDISMPVVFYVDPAIADARDLDDVDTITLSYTFFKAQSQALDKAMEGLYNR